MQASRPREPTAPTPLPYRSAAAGCVHDQRDTEQTDQRAGDVPPVRAVTISDPVPHRRPGDEHAPRTRRESGRSSRRVARWRPDRTRPARQPRHRSHSEHHSGEEERGGRRSRARACEPEQSQYRPGAADGAGWGARAGKVTIADDCAHRGSSVVSGVAMSRSGIGQRSLRAHAARSSHPASSASARLAASPTPPDSHDDDAHRNRSLTPLNRGSPQQTPRCDGYLVWAGLVVRRTARVPSLPERE